MDIARFTAIREAVAVCEVCLTPHPKATALAPWTAEPHCMNVACGGKLVFPDDRQTGARHAQEAH